MSFLEFFSSSFRLFANRFEEMTAKDATANTHTTYRVSYTTFQNLKFSYMYSEKKEVLQNIVSSGTVISTITSRETSYFILFKWSVELQTSRTSASIWLLPLLTYGFYWKDYSAPLCVSCTYLGRHRKISVICSFGMPPPCPTWQMIRFIRAKYLRGKFTIYQGSFLFMVGTWLTIRFINETYYIHINVLFLWFVCYQ